MITISFQKKSHSSDSDLQQAQRAKDDLRTKEPGASLGERYARSVWTDYDAHFCIIVWLAYLSQIALKDGSWWKYYFGHLARLLKSVVWGKVEKEFCKLNSKHFSRIDPWSCTECCKHNPWSWAKLCPQLLWFQRRCSCFKMDTCETTEQSTSCCQRRWAWWQRNGVHRLCSNDLPLHTMNYYDYYHLLNELPKLLSCRKGGSQWILGFEFLWESARSFGSLACCLGLECPQKIPGVSATVATNIKCWRLRIFHSSSIFIHSVRNKFINVQNSWSYGQKETLPVVS